MKTRTHRMTRQSEIRASFWESHPQFTRQNDYNATIRSAFVEWVDCLSREGEISGPLADRVTL